MNATSRLKVGSPSQWFSAALAKIASTILFCLSVTTATPVFAESGDELTQRGATNLLSEIEYLEAARKPLPEPFSANDLRELRAGTVNFIMCNGGGTFEDWAKYARPILILAAAYSAENPDLGIEESYFDRLSANDCSVDRRNKHVAVRNTLKQIEPLFEYNKKIDEAINKRIGALNFLAGLDF